MKPLHIVAHLSGPVRLPHGWLALDSLLGAAVCVREGIPPALTGEPLTDLTPWLSRALARSECGRLWLASFSVGEPEQAEKRWVTKRPPIAEAQSMGSDRVRSINIGAGPMKAIRRPAEATHMRGDRLDWFAVGDAAEVRDLLSFVPACGSKRNAGDGGVRRWSVDEVEPWSPGFPCVLAGLPLRPLPLDWPGVDQTKATVETMALSPPYWPHDPAARVDVLVPARW